MVSPATPNAKCCNLKVSICIKFYKSTIMKSMIRSQAEKETTESFAAFDKEIKSRGYNFKEKKKPKGQAVESGYKKMSH